MQAQSPLTLLYTMFVLSVLAVATPWGVTTTSSNTVTVTKTVTATAPAATVTAPSDCNTGSISCCNSVVSSTDAGANLLAGLLGIVIGSITGLVGLDCSPISVIGIGSGNACSAHPVCCENDSTGGLINIGCIPITL